MGSTAPSNSTSLNASHGRVSSDDTASASTPKHMPDTKPKRPPFKEVEAGRPDYNHAHEPIWTKVPEPEFKPGQGLNGMPQSQNFDPRSAKYRSIKPEEHEKAEIYRMMISAITPRPVAFMSTLGPSGAHNLAPMSYFNMVAHDPPTIMISIQTAPRGPNANADGLKDTNSHIRSAGEFCCSIISEPFLEAMNYTSIDAPRGVDEWKLAGLTKRASEVVKPPHVAESAFSMECTLMHWYDVTNDAGEATNTVVLGRVRRFHVNEYCFSGDELKLSPEKLMPITRLGGITYGRITDYMEVPRPVWAEVKDTPEVRAALDAPDKTA